MNRIDFFGENSNVVWAISAIQQIQKHKDKKWHSDGFIPMMLMFEQGQKIHINKLLLLTKRSWQRAL